VRRKLADLVLAERTVPDEMVAGPSSPLPMAFSFFFASFLPSRPVLLFALLPLFLVVVLPPKLTDFLVVRDFPLGAEFDTASSGRTVDVPSGDGSLSIRRSGKASSLPLGGNSSSSEGGTTEDDDADSFR